MTESRVDDALLEGRDGVTKDLHFLNKTWGQQRMAITLDKEGGPWTHWVPDGRSAALSQTDPSAGDLS